MATADPTPEQAVSRPGFRLSVRDGIVIVLAGQGAGRIKTGRYVRYAENQQLGRLHLALLERFEKYRLPAALKLKEKVDNGGLLDKRDMMFLETIEKDSKKKLKACMTELSVNTLWEEISNTTAFSNALILLLA